MMSTLHKIVLVLSGPIVCVLGLAMAGCGRPMKVDSYWGPGVRFTESTRTYAWAPDADRASGEGRPENPRAHERIRQGVEEQLAKKGYQRVADGPDFWIDYRVARNLRGDPYGGPHFQEVNEGSLVLYAVNPEDSKLIWRGEAKAILKDDDPPDQRLEIFERAVKSLLDEVPSRPDAK